MYLYLQTKFKCVHGYNCIHTSMLQKSNPKLARVCSHYQSSNSPWPSLNIGQSMLGMLSFNVLQYLTRDRWKWGQWGAPPYIEIGWVLHPMKPIFSSWTIGSVTSSGQYGGEKWQSTKTNDCYLAIDLVRSTIG